jgi:hypothetical protein
MKKCWAYQPIAGSRTAWVPCARMAEEGARFCRAHGRAIEGAVLGALVRAEPVDEAVTLYEERAPWKFERGKRTHFENAIAPQRSRRRRIARKS